LIDPVEDGFDLVIRVDPSHDDRLVGRRILDDQRLVVAHPDMAMPMPSAVHEAAPSVQAVFASSSAADVVWQFLTSNGEKRLFKPVAALRLSSLMMVRDAVLAGAGAALLPKLPVEDDIANGRLAHWGTDANPPVEIWALRNSRRLVGAKVRAFLDVIEQAFPGRVFVPPA
jgi:DNA-binding transcriptional LysR family regulator